MEQLLDFGMEKIENAFHTIDSGQERILSSENVNCNRKEFQTLYNYILNGVHAIWNFKILDIKDEKIEIEYKGVKIHIAFNIRGAY